MKFGLVGNTGKPVIKKIIPDLLNWLVDQNIEFTVEEKLYKYLKFSNKFSSFKLEQIGQSCDYVLAFGGDGTILSTARAVHRSGVPILGVNLGGLGFLTEVTIDKLYDSIEEIIDKRYSILERMVLKVETSAEMEAKTFYPLNDLVIDKGSSSRVIWTKIYINNNYLTTYLSDGVIIATPTGSTAYSLSAFGPILMPNVNAIVINPMCPHSLGARPVVIPDDSTIKIIPYFEGKQAMLIADGQVEKCLSSGEEIIITKADYKVRWIQYQGSNFFNTLRTKLNWGVDKRMDSKKLEF